MKRVLEPKFLLAAASLVIVGLLALSDLAAPGPGPLHPSHSGIAELAGRNGCVVCHGDDSSAASMLAGCSSCHADIADQITSEFGLHGVMSLDSGVDARHCATCHGEHLGAALELVDDTTFVRAGFTGLESFEHTPLGYSPEGRHTELDCAECHANAHVDVLADGASRFLGLQQDCVACHDDPHEGRMTEGCATCHGQVESFDTVALFEHTSRFALNGSHAAIACVECHAPDSRWSIERSSSKTPAQDRTCFDCHDSPHDPSFLARSGAACAECHTRDHEHFNEVVPATMSSFHDATGFALDNAHASVECAECHEAGLPFADRFPGRVAKNCSTCHTDTHDGQFAGRARDEAGCVNCHDTQAFTPSMVDVERHAALGFLLDGAHASADCSECHAAAEAGGVSTFRGTPRECAACHEDTHRGAFAPSRPSAAPAANVTVVTDCAQCHGTEAFSPLVAETFDHGHWTGFALDGAHLVVECTTCHGESTSSTRQLGWVTDRYQGPVERCDTCHDTPHGDRFDTQDGATDCATCHVTSDFLEIVPGSFDHINATGFALDGSHAQARCTACHVPIEDAVHRLGKVRLAFVGPVDRCATCHKDPHKGAFDSVETSANGESQIGCARCHQPLSFRTVDSFDHDNWTGWALSGAHSDASCADCHRPQAKDDLGRSSAFAPGSSCADCHEDPHLGQFGDAGEKADCAACHTSDETFHDTSFDHDTARFVLDETHAPLACASCHLAATTTDGRSAVRYRPLGRECGDCHDPNSGGGAPRRVK